MQGGGGGLWEAKGSQKGPIPDFFCPYNYSPPFSENANQVGAFFVVFGDFDPIFALPRPEDECCRMQKLKKRGLSQFLPTGQIFYCAQCVHEDDLFISP